MDEDIDGYPQNPTSLQGGGHRLTRDYVPSGISSSCLTCVHLSLYKMVHLWGHSAVILAERPSVYTMDASTRAVDTIKSSVGG